jgi:hypothetical protein
VQGRDRSGGFLVCERAGTYAPTIGQGHRVIIQKEIPQGDLRVSQ